MTSGETPTRVRIQGPLDDPSALRAALQGLSDTDAIRYDLEDITASFRGTDATVLVALVTGGAAVLGQLVASIASLVTSRNEKATIRLVGKRGSIDVPTTYDVSQIRELLKLRRELDVTDICVVSSNHDLDQSKP